MGRLALAHLVLLALDGGVNLVLLRALVRVLLHGLGRAGLAGTGSEEVLS